MLSLISDTSSDEISKFIFLAKITVLVGLIGLMLYVPFVNKCYLLAMGLVFISGSWMQDWKLLLKDKVIVTGLILILLFTIGIFYSQGSINYSLRMWDKYLKIIYILFFLPLFIDKRMRQAAIYCLITTVIISEIFTYLHYFNLISLGLPPTKHWLFVQDIDAGFIVSFVCYVLAFLIVSQKQFRSLFIICFTACSIDVLLLNQERTGYLIYFCLAGLFLCQKFRLKGLIVGLTAIPLIFTLLFLSSPQFNQRVNQVVSDIGNYKNGNKETSIGLRLSFAEYSLTIIKKHPFYGAGTGSFEEVYRSLNGPKINNETWPAHPHNEYISILFQIGIVGLAVFLYWIYLQIRYSSKLDSPEKFLLQGLIVGFCLLSFCNASLQVNPAGDCYILFLTVFLAANYERRMIS